MSRERYRDGGHGRGERWDTERFEMERDRERHGTETREHFEERETRYSSVGGHGRPRERSVDEVYERERIGPRGGYEQDRYERREHYDDEPRYAKEIPSERERAHNVTIEERDTFYSPHRAGPPPPRPEFMRRRSSLDSFDRRPLTRFVEREREEYAPTSSSYSDGPRPPPLTPIRPRGPPPRRYEEREYDDISVAEPDLYGDEEFRGYPERVREREIIRRRRRSGSRGSATSTRSGSVFSESVSVKSEFPKKGKTRMPAKLVSKKAITDLGYTFEEEGNVVIIQKALGRENIDEVIKLSEDYKASGKCDEKPEVVIHETTHEIITTPVAAPPKIEIVSDTKIVETRSISPSPSHHHHHHHHTDTKIIETRSVSPSPSHHHHHRHSSHHNNPIIVEAGRPREEYCDPVAVGALALIRPHSRSHSRHSSREDRAIRNEIAMLEAERARRHERDYHRVRHHGRSSESELILYERDTYDGPSEEYTLVRREREPDIGVRIEKDKKGPPPKLLRAMLKTLT